MNAWPWITTDAVRSRLEPAHRSKPGLESAVVGFDAVVGVLGGVMVGGWQQLDDRAGQRRGPISCHLGRFAMRPDRSGEEPGRRLDVAFGGDQHVDDLPVLVDGAVHEPPGAGHLHVGLIDEPPVPDRVSAWPSCVDDQRSEALHPAVQGDVVDLDAALGQELLKISVGQSEAQVPAHREQDHLRRELEARERRAWPASWAIGAVTLHPTSLAHRADGHSHWPSLPRAL